MKKITLFLISALIIFSSATIAPTVKPVDPSKVKTINAAIELAKADGKVTSKELRNIAEIAKGQKLSLKERIALKVFGKKIGNKMVAETSNAVGGGKSQVIALILCILLGGLGIHRFYLGYTWQGIVQLLTGGGCGIWALIDLIRIIMGTLEPKDGGYDQTL